MKKECAAFVTVRSMHVVPNGPNRLWISLDTSKMLDAMKGDSSMPQDMCETASNGLGIFPKKQAYSYKKAS